MKQLIKTYITAEKGATAIEYTLIACGVSLAISVAVFAFGGDITELFEYARERFNERPS